MNNSVFGNIMENIRNHKNRKLVRSRKKHTKCVIQPIFKDGYSFSKESFTVEMLKTEIKMNKPVYIGQASNIGPKQDVNV